MIFYCKEGLMNSNLDVLIDELINRAKICFHIYRALSKEIGKYLAVTAPKRAIYDSIADFQL
jgi:hypothetical protein